MKNVEIPNHEFTPELRSVGWAPGHYVCICDNCDKHHVADKGSRICLSCAEKRLERLSEVPE